MTKLGAIWRGRMKSGETYFHGEIEIVAGIKTRIVLFPFKSKDGKVNSKAPAYNIEINKPFTKEESNGKPTIETVVVSD